MKCLHIQKMLQIVVIRLSKHFHTQNKTQSIADPVLFHNSLSTTPVIIHDLLLSPKCLPLSGDLSLSICLHWGFFLCFHPSLPPFSPPLQPSVLFSSKAIHEPSTVPTATAAAASATSTPHLCQTVSNVIVLTPAVCVYVGESCWVRVIATLHPPSLTLLPPLSACRPAVPYAPQVSCHCRSEPPDTLARQE